MINGYNKDELRRKMLDFRLRLSDQEIEIMSKDICERLEGIQVIRDAKSIMGYYPIRKEANILPFLDKIKNEKMVLLPYSKKKEKEIIAVIFEGILTEDDFGIPSPPFTRIYEKEIDVILVPGLAFDISLHRLGYGFGFYDKFLRRMKKSFKIGIAYDFQILEAIPTDNKDIRMDMIITEKRIISE